MMTSRFNLLFTNILVFGLSVTLSKIINLLGLPILTNIIDTPVSFGIWEICLTFGGLGAAVSNFGTNEGTYKIYFDAADQSTKNKILQNYFFVSLASILFVVVIEFMLSGISGSILPKEFSGINLIPIIILYTVFLRLRNVLELPLQINNQKKKILYIGIAEIVVFYAVVFTAGVSFGKYYNLAVSRLVSISFACLLIFLIGNTNLKIGSPDKAVIKKLVYIGLPLVLSSLFYWALQLVDRILITKYLSAGDLGIYSIGFKLAAVSEIFRAALTLGFPFFFYTTVKDPGHKDRIRKIITILLLISILLFSVGSLTAESIFSLLINSEYRSAHTFFPVLLLSPLLLTVFQIVIAEFIYKEKTLLITFTQIISVLVNVVIGILLIPRIGLKGAAFAAFSGYFTLFLISLLAAGKYRIIPVKKEYFILLGIILAQVLLHVFAEKISFAAHWISIGMSVMALITIFIIVQPYLNHLGMNITLKFKHDK